MQFSVVIPVHNECENVEKLTAEINESVAPAHTYEIIIVDDHSTDNTLEKLQILAEATEHFAYVRHGRQRGQSAALRTGVQRAKYPIIVTLDGDGQNNPKDIELLLAPFAAESSIAQSILVNGYRVNRHDTSWRRFSSRIANRVRGFFLGDNTPDSGCGMKAYHRENFLELPTFNHMHRFIPALFLQQGGRVINVPVDHRPRIHGRSKYGTLDRLFCGIIDLFGVMWLGRRNIKTEILPNEADNG